MYIWNKNELSKALGVISHYCGNIVHFNSKDILPEDIFIALKLKNYGDGHDYVIDALNRGASIAIVDRKIEGVDEYRLLLVKDTYDALLRLAYYKREHLLQKAKIVGITGSVGKTSTKALFEFASSVKTFVSRGNFNNHIGMPLNLASMPRDIELAVLEIGMNHCGEITKLVNVAKPHIAMVTNVTPAHTENFNSLSELVDAKSEIFSGLDIKDGIAIICSDDQIVHERLLYNIANLGVKNVYSFGKDKKADAFLINYTFKDRASTIEASILGENVSFQTAMWGERHAINIIGVLLALKLLGQDISTAFTNIKNFKNLPGRGAIIDCEAFGKKFSIIDDCYNASPASVHAALTHLAFFTEYSKKIVVLADMLELGDMAREYHEDIAITNIDVYKVIAVGPLMRYLYDKLPNTIVRHHFDNVNDLQEAIHSIIEDKALILFKGSNGTKLRDVVQFITGII